MKSLFAILVSLFTIQASAAKMQSLGNQTFTVTLGDQNQSLVINADVTRSASTDRRGVVERVNLENLKLSVPGIKHDTLLLDLEFQRDREPLRQICAQIGGELGIDLPYAGAGLNFIPWKLKVFGRYQFAILKRDGIEVTTEKLNPGYYIPVFGCSNRDFPI